MIEENSIRDADARLIASKTQFKYYPDVLNVQQAAELLFVCKNTIYKLIKEQEIPCRRIGTAIRIRKKDLQYYMENSRFSGCH